MSGHRAKGDRLVRAKVLPVCDNGRCIGPLYSIRCVLRVTFETSILSLFPIHGLRHVFS